MFVDKIDRRRCTTLQCSFQFQQTTEWIKVIAEDGGDDPVGSTTCHESL